MQLTIQRIDFDLAVEFSEMSAFRGAVARLLSDQLKKSGSPELADLAHQHEKDSSVIYRYPLIQYKHLYGRAAIIGIGEGANAVECLRNLGHEAVRLHGRHAQLTTLQQKRNTLGLRLLPEPQTYTINKWIALNADNYAQYQVADGLIGRAMILESLLKHHVVEFAKGVGWHIPQKFRLHIQEMESYPIGFKGNTFLAFTVKFATDAFLPNYIGLGKGKSHGYGMIKQVSSKKGHRRP